MYSTGGIYFSDDLDKSSDALFQWLKSYCGETIKGSVHMCKDSSSLRGDLSFDSLDFDFLATKKKQALYDF